MFRIFISKLINEELPGKECLASFECEDAQVAAQACLDLRKMGYAIHKVDLPSGESLEGLAIDLTILAGVSSASKHSK